MSRETYQNLHYPSTKTLKNYVNNNLINNCEIITDNVNRAEITHGPEVPYTQGQMTRRRPLIHEKIGKVPLPPRIAQHHYTIALSIDFFFVNETFSSIPNLIRLIS